MYHWQICSLIQWAVYPFCWWFPVLCKTFSLIESHLFIIFFCCPRIYVRKILLWKLSEILLPVFSFRIFMVSRLTFKCLIHFNFILIYSIRKWSSFIFLHLSVQFSKHHLLNRLSLPHCMSSPSLSNINWPKRHEFISGLSFLLY